MKDHKKEDTLFKNVIIPNVNDKAVSAKPAGNADKDPFCIYEHKRHAVGSVIKQKDGSNLVCNKDGEWENKE